MIAVAVPTTDVNSETATVVRWYVPDQAEVRIGDVLVQVETSKAIIDVATTHGGILLRAANEGEDVRIADPLGFIFDSAAELERYVRQQKRAPLGRDHAPQWITAPARRRAAELGVDINELARQTDGLVTGKLVDEFAARTEPAPPVDLPEPLQAPPSVLRLAIIGGGLGATQVLDILLHDESQTAVAIFDDDPGRWGVTVSGVPIVGGRERLTQLCGSGQLDAAIISISTSVPARTRLRQLCAELGLPLANAVDPTVRICSSVDIGRGNVICAHCHIGVETVVGDNNFLSAFNSYDHHNELGSDISTGPGCMTSGLVKVGDRCRLGTGIFCEPHVELGAGVQVASGATIVSSVPANHAVKAKLFTTTVVPIKPDDRALSDRSDG